MSRCRCGHIEIDHSPRGGIFPTENDTIVGGTACRRCPCPHFHTTSYKTRISQLRRAARDCHGQPLQPLLFREDTAQETGNTGDPARPLAPKQRRATP
jgi:hypothetical protein